MTATTKAPAPTIRAAEKYGIAYLLYEFHGGNYFFPVRYCGRCGGGGEYSYCTAYGTTCFGCSGSGVVGVGGKAGLVNAAYREAKRARMRPVGADLAVGDFVLPDLEGPGFGGARKVDEDEWVEVVKIERGDREMGWSITRGPDGEEIRTPTAWDLFVTLANGAVVKATTNTIVRRRLLVSEKYALVAEYQAQLPPKYRKVAA